MNDSPRVWVYGDVIIEPEQPATTKRAVIPFAVYIQERTFPEHCTQRRKYRVVPVSVGQALGMQDKTGKDAYLDDIVFLEPKNLRRIIWYDNRFCLESQRGGDNIDISYVRGGIIVSNAHELEKYGNG